jgi:hypothetical protein
MQKKFKRGIVVGATTVALVGGGVAYAYWSTSGSGTGSAATSAGAANLAIAQTSTISNMYPGDTPQTIAGTVTVSITGVTQAQGATGTCDASDYTLSSPDMAIGKDVAAGASTSFSGATIQFNNKASNQDGCKGATVNLAYAAS